MEMVNPVVCHAQEDGSYAGFDDKELTSRSGGKLQAILRIKVVLGDYFSPGFTALYVGKWKFRAAQFIVYVQSSDAIVTLSFQWQWPQHCRVYCLVMTCSGGMLMLLCSRSNAATRLWSWWVMEPRTWKPGRRGVLISSLGDTPRRCIVYMCLYFAAMYFGGRASLTPLWIQIQLNLSTGPIRMQFLQCMPPMSSMATVVSFDKRLSTH